MIGLSAMLAGFESIRRLFEPEPLTNPGWVLAAGLIGFAGNELVAVQRIRRPTRIRWTATSSLAGLRTRHPARPRTSHNSLTGSASNNRRIDSNPGQHGRQPYYCHDEQPGQVLDVSVAVGVASRTWPGCSS